MTRLTRAQSVKFLNERGYPISLTYFDALCAPGSGGLGPPSLGRFGNRCLYRPSDLEAWAQARLVPAENANDQGRAAV
jgi:hypothetical protein